MKTFNIENHSKFEDMLFSEEKMVLKPELNIEINQESNFISVYFTYDQTLQEIFKNIFKSVKFNFEEKKYFITYNKTNLNKLDKFLIDVQNDYNGSVSDKFDFKLIKTGNFIENNKIEKVSDFIEIKNEEIPAKKEKKEIVVNASNKESIFAQKKTNKESIEETCWNLFQDKIKVDRSTRSVFMYNENVGCYTVQSNEGIKPIVAKELEKLGLESYINDKDLNSIEKTLNIRAISNNKLSSFNNEFTAVRFKEKNGNVFNALIYVSFKENGSRAFRVVNCSHLVETKVSADITLDASLIKDNQGNIWTNEDLDENKFFYDFKVNKKADLYKLFLDNLFDSKNFLKIAKMFMSGILTNRKIQKILIMIGEGGDGKSVILGMLSKLFKMVTVFGSFNKEKNGDNRFLYSPFKNKNLVIVDEVSKNNFDDTTVKKITSTVEFSIETKGGSNFNLNPINVSCIIAMNYTNMPHISEIDRALKRRFLNVKCSKSKEVILDFDQKIMNGFYYEKEERFVEAQDVEFFHFLLEGALELLNEDAFSDGEITAEKYGEDVAIFNHDIFEMMSPKGAFFSEFTLCRTEKFKACKYDDLYKYYLNWVTETNDTKVGYNTFKRELNKAAKELLQINMAASEVRIDFENRASRGIPVNIFGSNIKEYNVKKGYTKQLINTGAISQEEYDRYSQVLINDKVETQDPANALYSLTKENEKKEKELEYSQEHYKKLEKENKELKEKQEKIEKNMEDLVKRLNEDENIKKVNKLKDENNRKDALIKRMFEKLEAIEKELKIKNDGKPTFDDDLLDYQKQ